MDMREIALRLRHTLIFTAFDRLAPGEAFCLFHNHDQKPLRHHFGARRSGAFGRQDLE